MTILGNHPIQTLLHRLNMYQADPGGLLYHNRFWRVKIKYCSFYDMFGLYVYSSRRTLVYLVLTLYHMYPDYEFRYLSILYCNRDASICVGIKRRIMGNVTGSFYGDMATRYIIPLLIALGVLSKGLTDSSENCCSSSWEFKSLHFPSLVVVIYLVGYYLP